MIYPDECIMINTFSKNRKDVSIFLYRKGERIYKGEIKDISLETFVKLSETLDNLMEINNSNLAVKIGINEIQDFIEEFR